MDTSGVGYFWLEDMGDIVMEDRDRIGPTHRQRDESERTEGRLEGGEVVRRLGQAALVVADIEVEHTAASAPGEVFTDLICEWGDSSVFNGDAIKWLKTVDDTK